MCNIHTYGLLPTAQKQFGHDPTLWKLQEDNNLIHMSKLTIRWTEEKGIEKIETNTLIDLPLYFDLISP